MICPQIMQRLPLRHRVLLVKKRDDRLFPDIQLIERVINNVHLLLVLRVGSIHHMQNVVRVFCLLERTLKRLDQMVRQLPYKTDRIGQKNLLSARKF